MVVNILTKAIRELCAKAVKDFRLPTKDAPGPGKKEKVLKAPQIINGFLPPKRANDNDDFPFVLVRPEQGTTDRGSEEIKVNIIIGCYSEEYDGFEFGINVMERIKAAISQLPAETLENRYQMRYPIKWSMANDQPYPQWQIDIETTWVMNAPVNVDEF